MFRVNPLYAWLRSGNWLATSRYATITLVDCTSLSSKLRISIRKDFLCREYSALLQQHLRYKKTARECVLQAKWAGKKRPFSRFLSSESNRYDDQENYIVDVGVCFFDGSQKRKVHRVSNAFGHYKWMDSTTEFAEQHGQDFLDTSDDEFVNETAYEEEHSTVDIEEVDGEKDHDIKEINYKSLKFKKKKEKWKESIKKRRRKKQERDERCETEGEEDHIDPDLGVWNTYERNFPFQNAKRYGHADTVGENYLISKVHDAIDVRARSLARKCAAAGPLDTDCLLSNRNWLNTPLECLPKGLPYARTYDPEIPPNDIGLMANRTVLVGSKHANARMFLTPKTEFAIQRLAHYVQHHPLFLFSPCLFSVVIPRATANQYISELGLDLHSDIFPAAKRYPCLFSSSMSFTNHVLPLVHSLAKMVRIEWQGAGAGTGDDWMALEKSLRLQIAGRYLLKNPYLILGANVESITESNQIIAKAI
eukprot:Ihof_evm3s497 gene=Ihof_evmTU3s497